MTSIFQGAAEAIGLADPDAIDELARIGREMATLHKKYRSVLLRLHGSPAWPDRSEWLQDANSISNAADIYQELYDAAYDRILAERSAPEAAE